jgi:hypothetical protein
VIFSPVIRLLLFRRRPTGERCNLRWICQPFAVNVKFPATGRGAPIFVKADTKYKPRTRIGFRTAAPHKTGHKNLHRGGALAGSGDQPRRWLPASFIITRKSLFPPVSPIRGGGARRESSPLILRDRISRKASALVNLITILDRHLADQSVIRSEMLDRFATLVRGMLKN